MGLFKERKKFALLSLLSALVVVSTAFLGISIYAQTDDSEMTTFEEEANPTEERTATDDTTSTASSNTAEDESTSIADVQSLFDGLVVCNVGTAEISGETEVASVDESLTTPTVFVEVMTETEVAELAANETETASADNETSTVSANCIEVDVNNATSTSSTNATDAANTTSTAGSNETPAGNASSTANETSTGNATSLGLSNQTSTASAPESERQILVIEGQDFVPGQAVLMWTENALLAIDDVDSDGSIEAKVPMPEAGGTAIAGNDTASMSTELRFVETGTQRTATLEFDGQTLTAAAGGDIEVEGGEGGNAGTTTATAPSDNTTSTNNTGSNYTVQ